jgi:glycosyltransferase involved in cell wall biosynthesis
VSTGTLGEYAEKENVVIKKYPNAKKSWIHRFFFELIEAPRIVRRWHPDAVLSLQNTAIFRCAIPQIIYIHQSLPYAPRRFSIFKRDEFFLFIYSTAYRFFIQKSLKRAHAIVVQTNWFRDAIVKRSRIQKDKIIVVAPGVHFTAPSGRLSPVPGSFFYPTTPYIYKNLDIVVKAVIHLLNAGLNPLIYITIRGDENAYAKRLKKLIQRTCPDSFRFQGWLEREHVINFYRKAVLLFPSTIESFGLPLLEARLVGAIILASDMPFCHEILDGYSRAEYFDPFDEYEIAAAMKRHMTVKKSGQYESPLGIDSIEYATESKWEKVIDLLLCAAKGQSMRSLV